MRIAMPVGLQALLLLLLGAVLATGVSDGRSRDGRQVVPVPSDSGTVAQAVRAFYDLYTARDFDSLYARAHSSIRQGGMTAANFRGFMREKRDRLGPVRSVKIDVSDGVSRTPTAVVTVTFEHVTQTERWQLVIEDDLVQWRSFQTTASSEAGAQSGRSATAAAVAVGNEVPAFRVAALRDSTRSFVPDDFGGQYVLLNFWATWCAPCIEKIPAQREAFNRFDDDFTILNVSFDRSRADVRSFLAQHELPGPHAFAGIRGFQGPLADAFGLTGIPDPVLVGPDGRVVATRSRIEREGLGSVLEGELGDEGGGP